MKRLIAIFTIILLCVLSVSAQQVSRDINLLISQSESAKKSYGVNSDEYLASLDSVVQSAFEQQKYDIAFKYRNIHIDIIANKEGKESLNYAIDLSRLGNVASQLHPNNLQIAIDYHLKAYNLFDKLKVYDHIFYLVTTGQLSNLYANTGQYDLALQYQDKHLMCIKKVEGTSSISYLNACNVAINIADAAGSNALIDKYSKEILQNTSKLTNENIANYQFAIYAKHTMLWRQEKYQDATKTIIDYLEKVQNFIGNIICFYICRICKRKYNMSSIAICYAMLALAIYAEHRVWGAYCATPNLFYGIGYMDILMLLLGISVIILISIKYFPKKVNQNLNNTESSFILDYPIEAESEDLLNYTSSAHTLAEKIKNIDAKHSCSIGLIAPWGMGKTSYLNILKNCFDDESCIVLKFNPRHSISSDNIQSDFFNLLFSTLGQYDSRFNSSFKNYLKAINIIADDHLMNKVLNVHKIWDKGAEKEEVNDAIQHINKRIIVFIDDFDRLLRDEIIEVFKLIDGNASFTNLIFISAYDKEYINTIIECAHSQYHSFADKFFTIEVHLPIRPYAATYNYLLDNISKLLNISNEAKEEYNSIIGPNLDIVQRYLPTIRDVKRFLNIFIPRFTMLREEVEFKDYFFLSLIRYRFIKEYLTHQ